jgi:hypothetical protein
MNDFETDGPTLTEVMVALAIVLMVVMAVWMVAY